MDIAQRKILHYVWVGGAPYSDTDKRNIASWKKYNPDYLLVRWDETNIDFSVPFLAKAYKEKKWSNISNYMRLKSVYDFGGIYLDTDVMATKSFDSLLKHECFFGFALKEENTDWVNSATYGAAPKHWFIKKALYSLLKEFDGLEESNLSGPRIITTLLRKEGLKEYSDRGIQIKDIFLYPIRSFNPHSWTEKYKKGEIKKDTYAVHFWDKRW